MNPIITILMLLVATFSVTLTQAKSSPGEEDAKVAEEIRRLERTWLIDPYDPNDMSAFDRIVAHDFFITHSNGKLNEPFAAQATQLSNDGARVQYRPSPRVRVVPDIVFARYGSRALRLDLYLPVLSQEPGLLFVRLSRPASRGEPRTLSIRYHGKPTRGVRFFPDHMYSFYDTSHWLVCDFDPGDKATFSLKLTLPADLKVVANGRLIEQRALPENRVSYVWRQERPIPSYIFGFAAGIFQEVTIQDGAVRLHFFARSKYSQPQIERIFADTPDMLSFFEERSGVHYGGDHYTQVLASGFVEQEMSDFTVMRENYGDEVLADPRDDNLAVHEFAHQWWGNSVTCAGWADFWLNEAMAEFMMAAYREHRFGREEYDRDMELARERYARVRAAARDRPLAYHQPIKESQAGSPVIYDKGSLVFNLLRSKLGEKAFWEGIRRYTQAHFGGSVITSDLQAAMEKASGKSLSAFFDQWIYRTGIPDIVARHRWENGALIVELEQRQEPLWYVPLSIAVETSRGRESHHIVLTGKHQNARFPLTLEPLSVRIDDGGYLPMNIVHERTASMLLFQLAHEPDIAGRIDAMNDLKSVLASGSKQLRTLFSAALQQRIDKDSSRLVRKMAKQALAKMHTNS